MNIETTTENTVTITDFERQALLGVLNASGDHLTTITDLRWMTYLVIRIIKRSGLL
jgi:hypothetical protein